MEKVEGDTNQKCVIKKILPLDLKQILKNRKDEKSKVLLSIKHALGNKDQESPNGAVAKIPLMNNNNQIVFMSPSQKLVNSQVGTELGPPIKIVKPNPKYIVVQTAEPVPQSPVHIQNSVINMEHKNKLTVIPQKSPIRPAVDRDKQVADEIQEKMKELLKNQTIKMRECPKQKSIEEVLRVKDGFLPNGDFLGFHQFTKEDIIICRRLQRKKQILFSKYGYKFDSDSKQKMPELKKMMMKAPKKLEPIKKPSVVKKTVIPQKVLLKFKNDILENLKQRPDLNHKLNGNFFKPIEFPNKSDAMKRDVMKVKSLTQEKPVIQVNRANCIVIPPKSQPTEPPAISLIPQNEYVVIASQPVVQVPKIQPNVIVISTQQQQQHEQMNFAPQIIQNVEISSSGPIVGDEIEIQTYEVMNVCTENDYQIEEYESCQENQYTVGQEIQQSQKFERNIQFLQTCQEDHKNSRIQQIMEDQKVQEIENPKIQEVEKQKVQELIENQRIQELENQGVQESVNEENVLNEDTQEMEENQIIQEQNFQTEEIPEIPEVSQEQEVKMVVETPEEAEKIQDSEKNQEKFEIPKDQSINEISKEQETQKVEPLESFNFFSGNYSVIDKKLELIKDFDDSKEDHVTEMLKLLNPDDPDSPESHMYLFLRKFMRTAKLDKSVEQTLSGGPQDSKSDQEKDKTSEIDRPGETSRTLSEKSEIESEIFDKTSEILRTEKKKSSEIQEKPKEPENLKKKSEKKRKSREKSGMKRASSNSSLITPKKFVDLNEKYELLKKSLRSLYESVESIDTVQDFHKNVKNSPRKRKIIENVSSDEENFEDSREDFEETCETSSEAEKDLEETEESFPEPDQEERLEKSDENFQKSEENLIKPVENLEKHVENLMETEESLPKTQEDLEQSVPDLGNRENFMEIEENNENSEKISELKEISEKLEKTTEEIEEKRPKISQNQENSLEVVKSLEEIKESFHKPEKNLEISDQGLRICREYFTEIEENEEVSEKIGEFGKTSAKLEESEISTEKIEENVLESSQTQENLDQMTGVSESEQITSENLDKSCGTSEIYIQQPVEFSNVRRSFEATEQKHEESEKYEIIQNDFEIPVEPEICSENLKIPEPPPIIDFESAENSQNLVKSLETGDERPEIAQSSSENLQIQQIFEEAAEKSLDATEKPESYTEIPETKPEFMQISSENSGTTEANKIEEIVEKIIPHQEIEKSPAINPPKLAESPEKNTTVPQKSSKPFRIIGRIPVNLLSSLKKSGRAKKNQNVVEKVETPDKTREKAEISLEILEIPQKVVKNFEILKENLKVEQSSQISPETLEISTKSSEVPDESPKEELESPEKVEEEPINEIASEIIEIADIPEKISENEETLKEAEAEDSGKLSNEAENLQEDPGTDGSEEFTKSLELPEVLKQDPSFLEEPTIKPVLDSPEDSNDFQDMETTELHDSEEDQDEVPTEKSPITIVSESRDSAPCISLEESLSGASEDVQIVENVADNIPEDSEMPGSQKYENEEVVEQILPIQEETPVSQEEKKDVLEISPINELDSSSAPQESGQDISSMQETDAGAFKFEKSLEVISGTEILEHENLEVPVIKKSSSELIQSPAIYVQMQQEEEEEEKTEIAELPTVISSSIMVSIPLSNIEIPNKVQFHSLEAGNYSDSSSDFVPVRRKRRTVNWRKTLDSSSDEELIAYRKVPRREKRSNLREEILKKEEEKEPVINYQEDSFQEAPEISETPENSTRKRKRRTKKEIESEQKRIKPETNNNQVGQEIVDESVDQPKDGRVPYSKIVDVLSFAKNRGPRAGRNVKEDIKREKQENMRILKAASVFRCGKCKVDVEKGKWLQHVQQDGGFGWMEDIEPPVVFENYSDTLRRLINMMKIYDFTSLTCTLCGNVKKSAMGHLSHAYICGTSSEKQEELKIACEICDEKIFPFNSSLHKKTCAAKLTMEAEPEVIDDKEEEESDKGLDNAGRTKRKAVQKAKIKMKQMMKILDNPGDYVKREKKQFKCIFCGAKFNVYHDSIEHVKEQHDESEKNQLNYGNDDESSDAAIQEEESSSEDDVSSGVPEIEPSSPSEDEEMENVTYVDKPSHNFSMNSSVRSMSRLSVISSETPEMSLARRAMFNFTIALREKPISDTTNDWMKKMKNAQTYNLPIKLDLKSLDIQPNPVEVMESTFQVSSSIGYQSISVTVDSFQKQSTKCLQNPWQKLKVCESVIESDAAIMFCGGHISALDWSPFIGANGESYLAVACNCPDASENSFKSQDVSTSFIQIWEICDLKNDSRSLNSSSLIYAIPLAQGPVWSIKFYPIENKQEPSIGALAVTTSTGEVFVYSLPVLSNQSSVMNMEPTYRLRLTDEPPLDSLRQPCKLNWSKGGCEETLLGVGFKNGLVAIWDFKKFGIGEIQYPIYVIPAHPTTITAIDFHCANEIYLMTCALDRKIKVFSLNSSIPMEISSSVHKTRVLAGEWWINWATMMTGNDECFCGGYSNSMKQPHEIFKTSALMCNDHSITDLSLNNFLNVALFASDNGDLISYKLQQMAYFGGKQKNFGANRMYLGFTDYCETNKEDQLEQGVVFYDFKKGACLKQSLLKQDYEKSDFIRINQVSFNSNTNSSKFYAVGYNAGFVRIRQLKS